jgi:hypothetical protein
MAYSCNIILVREGRILYFLIVPIAKVEVKLLSSIVVVHCLLPVCYRFSTCKYLQLFNIQLPNVSANKIQMFGISFFLEGDMVYLSSPDEH